MSFASFISHSVWMQLGLSLAHFLWEGAVIAMLLAVALFMLRRRGPEIRHGACLVALLAMGLCPLVTLWYLHVNPPSELLAANMSTPAENARLTEPTLPIAPPTHPVTEASAPGSAELEPPPVQARTIAAAPPLATMPPKPMLAWGLTLAAMAWAVGVGVLGVRFVFAWLGLRRLRAGTQALPEAIERLAEKLRGVLKMHGAVPVRTSIAVSEPLAFGLLRPIVLVPAALLTQCPVEMLEAIIAHELAHVRRHDLWINMLQRVIETLLFYHPAVWWVSGRMRLERELCCDDAAIRATGKRADYANALVGLSRSLHGWTAPALSAGMFTSRLSLPQRVRRVLQIPSTQHDPNRGRYWMSGPAALLLAGSLVLVSSLRPGVAQNAVPVESTTAAEPATTAQPTVVASSKDDTIPKWWLPTDEPGKRRWEKVKLSELLDDFSATCGLRLITGQVNPTDLQKVMSFDGSQLRTFDEALNALNMQLFDMNCWVARQKEYLVIRPITEWYRHIPPNHMYMSEEEFQKAKLPEWEVALVVYAPHVWPANILGDQATDRTPMNGARATVTPDGKRVELVGFVHYINIELAIMKKWDVPPAPPADVARTYAAANPTVAASGSRYRPTGVVTTRPAVPAPVTTTRPAETAATRAPQRIQPGDTLAFELRDPKTGSIDAILGGIQVDEDGDIHFLVEQLGVIRVDGLSVAEAGQKITEAAKNVFDGDRVTVVVEPKETASAPATAAPAGVAATTLPPAAAVIPPGGAPRDAVPARTWTEGVIAEVLVTPGQAVKKGDVLIKLAAEAESRLELEAAMTRLKLTKTNYDRVAQQAAAGVTSMEDKNKLEADLKLAELDLQKWELRMLRAQVRSPVDGTVWQLKPSPVIGAPAETNLTGMHAEAGETLVWIAPMVATASTPPGTTSTPAQPRPARTENPVSGPAVTPKR